MTKKKDRRRGVLGKGKQVDNKPKEGLLCVRGPIYGPSGYARMTRNIIEGLHLAGKKFWVDATPWAVQPSIEVSDKFKEIIRAHAITREEMQNTGGLLVVSLPTDLSSRPITDNTWNQTIFETTRVPQQWVDILRSPGSIDPRMPAIKGLIVPCHGNRQSFNEVPQPIEVIPLAIDYDLYSPDGGKFGLYEASEFNILISYHQNPRKNPEFVIKLINEFGRGTTFYLKTFGMGMSSTERNRIADDLSQKIKSNCKVVLLYDIVTDEDQAFLYRSVDMLLNLSHGEGWDLPRVEAYSCGTPAIGPLFIGPRDYTIPEFRILNPRMVPCPDMPPFFDSSAQWVDLDLLDCIRAVENVRKNHERFKELALKQREHLIEYTGTLAQMAEKTWKTVMG